MGCGDITRGSEADCDDLPIGGTRARVVVYNFDEVESMPVDSEGRITAINLVDGAFGYEFTGFRNDVKKTDEVVIPDTGITKFKANLGWVIYERTQEQKNNVENLARGRFIVAAENKGKDADSIEIVGAGVGLQMIAGVIRDAHANGGFFVLNFSTPDEEGELEPKLPQTLGTDYEDALAILAATLPTS